MPRPGFPPTPGSSTEIRGKEHGETIEDFALPPAALHTAATAEQAPSQQPARQRRESSTGGDAQGSPTGGVKRKRRSMNADMQIAAQATGSDKGVFSLPPPPSRSRKIIQVQPEDASKPLSKASSSGHIRKKSESGKGAGSSNADAAGTSKSTAATRKTARKTAHSIIERRRRSKMNDEFETLKELVPAARGQNMHKLAILQAGIEYVRYLEDCVHGLKGAQQPSGSSSFRGTPLHFPVDSQHSGDMAIQDDDMDDEDDDMDEDDEESEREHAEAAQASTPRASRPGSIQQSVSNTPSPAMHPIGSHTSTSSYALSTGSPSPAMLPYNHSMFSATTASSTLPSPALLPNDYKSPLGASVGAGAFSGNATPITMAGSTVDYHALQAHAKKALAYHGEADQEVIATLAMMGTERRRSQEEKERTDGTRGMSVRDLLST